jgi:hypothetical protein
MDLDTKTDFDEGGEDTSKKITRREFLKNAALATGGIAISITACTSDKGESSDENKATASESSEEDHIANNSVSTVPPLSRTTRLAVAHEAMLAGILVNRAVLPQVILKTGDFDAMNEVAIEVWRGTSPVSTRRARSLMGIEGDTVAAIMKSLQLDVGFVHQYMDVRYVVHDDLHGEFWLNHCGALLDAEPYGKERVFGMCHTIEDPTFDATAQATNPRARTLPIHRPPREPADQIPHCRWTITIDPANEPVGPAALTQQVNELPLAQVPNAPPEAPSTDGWTDYRGDFDPAFTLAALSTDTLRAVQEEFVVQTHLLAASAELSLTARFGQEKARQMLASAWTGVSWITSQRLAAALELDDAPGAAGIAAVLAEQPLLPAGFCREVTIDGDTAVSVVLKAEVDGLLDSAHPGVPGLLARGDKGGWAAMAQAVDPRARLVDLAVENGQVTAEFTVEPDAEPATEPPETAVIAGLASRWVFTI